MIILNREEAIEKAGKVFINILDESLRKKLIETSNFSEWSTSIIDFKAQKNITMGRLCKEKSLVIEDPIIFDPQLEIPEHRHE